MEENFNNQNRARRRYPLPVSFKGNLSNLIAAFADTAVLCLCYTLTLISVRLDRFGNSGRNRNRIAMIWPEPDSELELDRHPKKVAGFDLIGWILSDFPKGNFSPIYKCYKS